ncbi:conjugal transfer protein TraG N-terminal domain-containing protein [Sphingopyxis sp. LK2115]|uniref:conjugal transfer protein TraG N-terminal domain-containing protein n=1 Tax=Sphingopyxis sp. LK2115 TaxID=2744558 RepID=UPI0016611DA6|nr:conjugal transfer protein TraG N-terminal domain-containing protein [Sphingopyxis sp. LK2115]
MCSRFLSALIAALAATVPTAALALETSFHTYDGFNETVDAFRLVSMIFADPRYETLVLIVAVAGIALGALLASVRGNGMGIVAFGFQTLVGIGLFVGMVATTGTVHVYDRVRNAYQPVGDVPNLIVLVAGVTNMMERAIAETIDDNTIDPNAKLEFGAGGHSFDLFLNAVSPRGPMTDTFLDATIKDYVRQCYPVARVSPAYGIDDDQLFRTTNDLPAAFAAMSGPATFSTVFTATDKGGTTVSCTETWTHISDRLSDPSLFHGYSQQVCERTGYDVSNAAQLQRCRSNLGALGDKMLATPLTLQQLMTNINLGNAVGDVLFEDSPATAARVMANRAVVSSGLATMSTANEWMPTTRMQGLLRSEGINMTKRELAMAQNGDLNLNVSPDVARQLRAAGLINDSQYGTIAEGGRARFSFADNDLLVSSSTGFTQSARSDTSTKYEAGKQAGPDTIENMLSSGPEGQAMMANWLRGGFEMDRNGEWRLNPQVADTLQRDVSAIMAQTGWQRAISRSAQDQISMGTAVGGNVGASAQSSDYASRGGPAKGKERSQTATSGSVGGSLGYSSSDMGTSNETARASLDIVNYDVREAISAAERAAARSANPEMTFTSELNRQVLGPEGLRNRYLGQADSARGTADITGPMTSLEQSSILSSGRFSTDLANGPFDGDSSYKKR